MQKIPLLIVEDEPDQLEIFSRLFVRGGYAVTAVHHPRQALEAATFKRFRAALVDYGLPEMNGLELIERLNLLLPDFQAVLLTDRDDQTLIHQEDGWSSYACLTKPCRLSRVQAVVKEVLEATALAVS